MSLREAALKRSGQVPSETVDWPQVGVVEIRGMTVRQARRFLTSVSKTNRDGETEIDRDRFTAGLLVATCFDPASGERVFEDADRDAVDEMDASEVQAVTAVAMRLSGFGGSPNASTPPEDGSSS